MKTVTIRNIPDDLYKAITHVAKRNRRSMQQEVLIALDRIRILDTELPSEKAAGIRNRLRGHQLGDTVKEVREERNR